MPPGYVLLAVHVMTRIEVLDEISYLHEELRCCASAKRWEEYEDIQSEIAQLCESIGTDEEELEAWT